MQDPTVQDRPFDDSAPGARGRHRAGGATGAGAAGSDAGAGVEVVRSEERLLVGTTRVPAERVRIHRDVVVEQVTRTFDVRREVLRIEREPIAPGTGDRGSGSGATAPRVVEVVLREERLVVDVEVVPVERVRISVGDVTETVRVAEDVRVERVELDAPERSPR